MDIIERSNRNLGAPSTACRDNLELLAYKLFRSNTIAAHSEYTFMAVYCRLQWILVSMELQSTYSMSQLFHVGSTFHLRNFSSSPGSSLFRTSMGTLFSTKLFKLGHGCSRNRFHRFVRDMKNGSQ